MFSGFGERETKWNRFTTQQSCKYFAEKLFLFAALRFETFKFIS